MTIQRIDFLGLPLDTGADVDDVCALIGAKGEAKLVTFINPYAWELARRQPDYRQALGQMSLILPDGEGVASVCRLLTGRPCRRLSFDMTSVAGPFLRKVAEKKASLVLIGGEPSVDEDVHAKLHMAYPDLNIVATSHGYGDLESKVAIVMGKKPAIVIVGMGSPRQEELLLALSAAGYKGLAITCGGFFDQYLKNEHYYPAWIDRLNLRFAWRLYMEPRRLWRRYLIEYQCYIWLALHALADKYMQQLKKRAATP